MMMMVVVVVVVDGDDDVSKNNISFQSFETVCVLNRLTKNC